MILERIVGRDVTNPVGEKTFHDVHYLRQMLFCVFKSLHQAQRKLAFHHADLRLANIMELMPTKESMGDETPKIATNSDRLQDTSSHDASYTSPGVNPSAQTGALSLNEAASQPYLNAHQLAPGPHQTAPVQQQHQHLADPRNLQPTGSLQQMSMLSDTIEANELPHMREKAAYHGNSMPRPSSNTPFKMIDFGLADFRETFGAGYVTGKKGKLIHNEPHHLEPLRSTAGAQVSFGFLTVPCTSFLSGAAS